MPSGSVSTFHGLRLWHYVEVGGKNGIKLFKKLAKSENYTKKKTPKSYWAANQEIEVKAQTYVKTIK